MKRKAHVKVRLYVAVANLIALLWMLLAYVTVRRAELRFARVAQPLWSLGHDQGDDHLLERPRNAGRDPRGRSGCRNLHRTRASAWRGRQSLQRPAVESTDREAIA